METTAAESIITSSLNFYLPDGHVPIFPSAPMWLTQQGMLFMVDDQNITIGFGIRSGLTPSRDILVKISDACRLTPVGHLWLAEGADDANWSLMWSIKQPLAWCSSEFLGLIIPSCIHHHEAILRLHSDNFKSFGGHDYWSSKDPSEETMSAIGLVMISHLG